jgi:O-antigen/teichoic acid export membrane protein
MKQRAFVFNLALLILLNLLIKPFWILGIDVSVQNEVGVEQYGLYFAIFNFTFLFNMLLDMGITNFNNRNIAQHTHLLRKHLSGILTLKLLLGVVYLAVALGVGIGIGYRGTRLYLLIWIAIGQFFNSLLLYLRSNISALLLFKTDSFLSIFDKLLMLATCAFLLWGRVGHGPFKIEWFVYAQTGSYAIAALIALGIVSRKATLPVLHWNPPFVLVILKKSIPFALLYLLMSCYSRMDAVMIERLLPADEAGRETGIYASAFRLLDALVMVAYLFSVILLPLFSKMLKNKEDIQPILRTSFLLLFYFAMTASSLLIIYRQPLLQLLYRDHVQESATVGMILFPCLLPLSLTYIFGTLLTANGNLKSLNIISLVAIVVNWTLNFLLIPHYYARGAAISSLATQWGVLIAQVCCVYFLFARAKVKLPYMRVLLFSVVFLVATLLIRNYAGLTFEALSWSAGGSLMLAWFCGLLPLKNMWKETRVAIK